MPAPILRWRTLDTDLHELPLLHTLFGGPSPSPLAQLSVPDLTDWPTPLQKAELLLQTAAEVEHALMAQYLYAAFSLKDPTEAPQEHQQNLGRWHGDLLRTAREEMGHLMTVQNLLHLLELDVNFEREDFPFDKALYPFKLRLEPVTQASLAKYVAAEMPEVPGPDAELQEIIQLATQSTGTLVNRVGVLYGLLGIVFTEKGTLEGNASKGSWYAGLKELADLLFASGESPDSWHLPTSAFTGAALNRQAKQDHWGDDTGVRVHAAGDRTSALEALRDIAEQGEGAGSVTTGSHYERFRRIYTEFPKHGEWTPVRAVPIDPKTSPGEGEITHPRSRAWAELCDLRYQLLLGYLEHFSRLEGDLYLPWDEVNVHPETGDRTLRGMLQSWCFEEMRRVGKIARKLTLLPLDDPAAAARAGAPFTLPSFPFLPQGERSRWLLHLRRLQQAQVRMEGLRAFDAEDAADPFLAALIEADRVRLQEVTTLLSGRLPDQPRDFKKVTWFLEEAVRFFEIPGPAFPIAARRKHGNFWVDVTVDEFINRPLPQFGGPVLQVGSPDTSRLAIVLGSGSMPARRPEMHPSRVAYISDWIKRGCPDSVPAGQPGLRREPYPAGTEPGAPVPAPPVPLPAPVPAPPTPAAPGFASDIRGLFRDFDRDSMLAFGFDLHRFEDVRDHSNAILTRVEDGSMPCDDPWPQARIDLFKAWIDGNHQP